MFAERTNQSTILGVVEHGQDIANCFGFVGIVEAASNDLSGSKLNLDVNLRLVSIQVDFHDVACFARW